MNSKPKISRTNPRKKAPKKPVKKVGGTTAEGEARLFKNQPAWSAWLDKNHRRSSGIWLRLAKKNSGLKSVTYAEALETGLCYGWIDGHKRPESEQAWLQRSVRDQQKAYGLRSIARRRLF